VVSRRAREPLARLAAETDGEILAADRFGGIDDAHAIRALRRDAGSAPGERVARRVPREWTAALAALAFAVLALELAAPGRPAGRERGTRTGPSPGRRARAPAAARAAALAFSGVAFASAVAQQAPLAALEARVRTRPDDARSLLELGLARAEAGDPDEAARALFAAAARARDPELAALAYFDLGVVELARGRLEPARDAFYDALAFDASDGEARFNLEWTLRALGAAPPPVGGAGQDESAPPASPPGPPPDTEQRREREPRTPPTPEARRAEPRPEREGEGAVQPAPSLSPEDAARWLDRVADDPGPSLRGAVRRSGTGEARRARVPRW
jgi:tetratricopeptide (TPR) repeat protein